TKAKTQKKRIDQELKSSLGPYWDSTERSRRRRSHVQQEKMKRSEETALEEIQKEATESAEHIVDTGIDLAMMVTDGTSIIQGALEGPDSEKWINAINSELKSLESHDTWSIVPADKNPGNLRSISSRMVLQEKIGEDGKVARYKARLVAHGFRQR